MKRWSVKANAPIHTVQCSQNRLSIRRHALKAVIGHRLNTKGVTDMWTSALSFLLVASSPSAEAAACDTYARRAKSAKGSAISPAFRALAKCDTGEAKATFNSMLPNANTVDSLVDLCMAAVETKVWTPVWSVLSHQALDYDVRDQVAQRIGAACNQNQDIVAFLQGAYFGIRDIEFQQWDDAFLACDNAALHDWVIQQAENPPNKMFDEKFNALLGILVQRKKAEALPSLAKGAVKAANSGPFDAILMQMDAAVQPGIGEDITADDKTALEQALVSVAQQVSPIKARTVADRLANAGARPAAAQLLPVVYPDRAGSDGTYSYGAASIERASCDGEKRIVIHTATIKEPGKRWIILSDVRAPMQALKPKLSKCDSEGEWAVSTTPEPVVSSKAIDQWVDGLVKQWEGKGYEVSTKGEKSITLD